VAANWTETPYLIVTSPYLRTQQTAAATIARFLDMPVEVWPIQEFTYLQPSRWNGTLSSERIPHIERPGVKPTQSFATEKVRRAFERCSAEPRPRSIRLEALPPESLVHVFSHGQFIQAVRSLVADSKLSDREKMQKFWGKGSPAIANAERVELQTEVGVWEAIKTWPRCTRSAAMGS